MISTKHMPMPGGCQKEDIQVNVCPLPSEWMMLMTSKTESQ